MIRLNALRASAQVPSRSFLKILTVVRALLLLALLAPIGAAAQHATVTASPSTFNSVGQQITFTYTIHPGSYYIDTISGTSQIKGVPITCQAPNGNSSFTCTSVYTVDALDDMSGRFSDFARFTGNRIGGTFEITSPTLAVTKSGGGPVSLSVSSSPNPTQPGETVTVQASISSMGCNSGLMPPGSLQVTIGSDGRSLPLVADQSWSTGDTVSFTTAALPAGSHSLTASYAGGGGCAARSVTGTSHVVEPRPGVSVSARAQSGASQSFDITFTAPVTGFSSSDITVVSTAGTVSKSVTGSGAKYVLTLTGMTQSGDLTVSVPAGGARTAAGSQNLATTAPTVASYVLATPVVTSVSPATGPAAGGTSVTITGSAFTGATAVSFDGQPASSFTVNSATSITAVTPATVPANTPGTVSVLVTTPGGTNPANTLFAYRAAQTITLADPADIASFVANQTVSLSASASSGLPVTLTSATPSICSVSGTTATVLAAGTCTVTADQAGDGNYTAAPQASQSFDIARAAQTIAFTSSPPTTAIAGGADYAVSATGGASSSAVIFSIDSASTGICTIAGNLVSFTAGGACIVNADQAGDGNYAAAPRASQTIAVGKQAQTISFTSTPPSAAVVGPVTYTVAATGGASGNPVLFSVAPGSGGICAISGSDVSMIGAGTCTIHADQAGSPVYAAAPQAQQSFAIAANTPPVANAGADQPTVTGGATVTLDASGSSDADAGQSLTFQWRQLSGPVVVLAPLTAAQPSFIAPTLAPGVGAETLVFEVTVNDGTGGMTTDTVSITIRDTTAPTVVIAGMPAQMSMGVSVPVTFTFSEPVTGFAQGDVAVSNAALSGFAGSGAIYTAMLRADGRGAVGLSVPAAAADDMAGNANLASQLMSVPLSATAETEELLAKEAVARGRALLSSQPDLSSLLSGTGRGGAMVSRGATGMTFDINTDPDSAIWLGLSGRWGLGEASTDRYVHGVLGAHLLRSSDLILGAMLQADHGETKDGAGKVEANGWLIGPYFAKRFGEDGLILSGSYLAGETDLANNPIGAYTDKATSERQVLTLSLMDEVALETLLLRPRLDLARVIEDRPSYIDGLGNRISASDLTLTEASAGLDFEVPIFVPSGLGWVSGGLSMIHDLEEVDGRSDRSTTRGRIDFGLLREYERGGTLDFSASYDGIGAPERGSIGLALLYSFQF